MILANLSGRIAALIAAVVILGVLIVGWFILLSPQRSKITSLDSEIAQTRDQIASTQAYVANPSTKTAVAKLARLKAMVPDDVHMPQVIRQLSSAATKAGVQIDGITPGIATAIGSAQAIPLQLTVEGHYFGLGNFLHLLRAQARLSGAEIAGNGRLYSVSALQLSSGSTSSGSSGAITATLTVNAFINAAPVVAPTTTTTTTTP